MDDDVQQFLSKISEEEFQRLGDLIMGNNKMESLQLSCQLVGRHFPHIPELACQHYGSYIHDMLQQSVKHYFAKENSLLGGGQQYTYIINNFFDYGEGDNLNDMYDISEDLVNMTLSINGRYNVLVLDENNNINLYPNALFLDEVSHEDEVIGLLFDIDGEEKSLQFDFFSIMNPDNVNELNLGHRNNLESGDDNSVDEDDDGHEDDDSDDDDSDDDSDDDDSDDSDDDDSDDEHDNEHDDDSDDNDEDEIKDDVKDEIKDDNNILHPLRPDEEWKGLGLENRPISDEDLSDFSDDSYDAHQDELKNNQWNQIDFPWQEHTTPREYYQTIEGHSYEEESESESKYDLGMQPDEEFRNMTKSISDIENADTEIDEADSDDENLEDADTDIDEGDSDDENLEDADTDIDEGDSDDDENLEDADTEPVHSQDTNFSNNYISFN